MKLLFDDKLAPITSEFGFVEAECRELANWFAEWEAAHQTKRGVTIASRSVHGTLEERLRLLEPLTSVEHRRSIFVATDGPWTAYFGNGWQGGDAAQLAHVARELACRAVRVVAVPDTIGARRGARAEGRYGGTIFELYGPRDTEFLNYIRTVALVNDGGKWTFSQFGNPLPEERLDRYQSRRVRDRFSGEDLDCVLRGLGIDAFREDFYDGPSVIVERTGATAPNMREYSLEAARRAIGC